MGAVVVIPGSGYEYGNLQVFHFATHHLIGLQRRTVDVTIHSSMIILHKLVALSQLISSSYYTFMFLDSKLK